ncbi:MAG TPA: hypothetical protein VFW49_07560 [Fluviicoccus sp.]|nr:hypothetical protein [Fluviicoccus sp.]
MRADGLLVLTACTLEALSLATLMIAQTDSGLMNSWLSFHIPAAVLMATGIWRMLPQAQRRPALGAWLLPFAVALFLPVLGMTGLLLCMLAAIWMPAALPVQRFTIMKPPEYRPVQLPAEPALPAGRIREQLSNGQSGSDLRMKALLAIRHLPARHTAAVLREALSDPSDDLRLLAYGMMEGKERDVMLRIQHALQRRDAQLRQGPAEQYAVVRELTELYWEMVYQNLVLGDMRRFALEQAALFAREALAINTTDGGMWLLCGRMHLQNGDYTAADDALAAAIRHGCLRVRAGPYIAELAFLRRDFHTVRNLMQQHLPDGRLPALRHAVTYWGKYEYPE